MPLHSSLHSAARLSNLRGVPTWGGGEVQGQNFYKVRVNDQQRRFVLQYLIYFARGKFETESLKRYSEATEALTLSLGS